MKHALSVLATTTGLALGSQALAHPGEAGHFISAHVAVPVAVVLAGLLAVGVIVRRSGSSDRSDKDPR
ncbi:MAG: hypothetical protein AAGA39_03630 [Pseudomonadota bacterium]